MLSRLQKTMVGHASLILLIAMSAGLGLLVSLVGGMELIPGHIIDFTIFGDHAAWARTHVGGILNALMIIAFALVIPGLGFRDIVARRVGWMLIGTGWANTAFYWGALLSPNRALTFGANKFGPTTIAGILGLAPALIFVFVSIVAVALVARQAFTSR